MKHATACAISCLIWIAAGVVFAADGEPAAGKVVTVKCQHDASQTYDCYLPEEYDAEKEWPILYCFSPNATGGVFVDAYKDVCQKHGWIVVGSNNARNGPWEPIQAAMDAIWKDTQARLSTSRMNCYATGWSGGSAVALDLAATHPERFAGVIPIAAGSGWDRILPRLPAHVSIYFVMGNEDSEEYVRQQAVELKEKGHKTEVNIFEGGHVWPPQETLEAGVDWLQGISRKPSARTRFKELEVLELRDDLTKRLGSAVRKASKGDLRGALAAANKVIASENASDEEKADAGYVQEEIQNRLESLSTTADSLLADGFPFEAQALLEILKRAHKGDDAKQIAARISALSATREQKRLLAAGKLYNKALESIEEGKTQLGEKLLQDVVSKHAGTRYAELAADQL